MILQHKHKFVYKNPKTGELEHFLVLKFDGKCGISHCVLSPDDAEVLNAYLDVRRRYSMDHNIPDTDPHMFVTAHRLSVIGHQISEILGRWMVISMPELQKPNYIIISMQKNLDRAPIGVYTVRRASATSAIVEIWNRVAELETGNVNIGQHARSHSARTSVRIYDRFKILNKDSIDSS